MFVFLLQDSAEWVSLLEDLTALVIMFLKYKNEQRKKNLRENVFILVDIYIYGFKHIYNFQKIVMF